MLLLMIKQIKKCTTPHDILMQYSSLFKVSLFMNEAHISPQKGTLHVAQQWAQ
nr:MAG TPA: hypothetical protein [Bacteriophage sp.]